MKRAALIGLDGMSWGILEKLFQWGVMPNLEELTEKSMKGTLRSTIPPESAPAWTSIATGVNPGKHGIFGFTKPTGNFNDSEILNSQDVKYLRIHEMIASQNGKSVCVNQLLTYPIKKIDGASVITDWLSPEIKWSSEIDEYAKNYRGPTLGVPQPLLRKDWDAEYDEMSTRVDTVNKLLTDTNWDLFWAIYSEPDHIFHRYHDMVMKQDRKVMTLFSKIDETFAVIKNLADLLFVVSDHGFMMANYGVYLNTYLQELGLAVGGSKRNISNIACQRQVDESRLQFHLPRNLYTHLSKLPASIESFLFKIYKQLLRLNVKARLMTNVDWKGSQVFAHGFGIYVKEGALIDEVVFKLKNAEFIGGIWKKEEIYNGKQLDDLPDLVIVPNFEGSFALRGDVIAPKTVVRREFSSHHPDGIIVIYNCNLEESWIKRVEVYDIVPTILRFLNLEIPKDTDGKIINSLTSIL